MLGLGWMVGSAVFFVDTNRNMSLKVRFFQIVCLPVLDFETLNAPR